MIFLILLGLFLIQVTFVNGYYLKYEVEELTNNLFENLRADPLLLGDLEFSEDSRTFIDRQVANYLNLIIKSEEIENSRSKRSIQENETTWDNFSIDIKPFSRIPVELSSDIILFQQNSMWYISSLENHFSRNSSQKLKIKKLLSNESKEITEIDISNGVAVAAFPLNTSTIVVVAENRSARQHFEHQTNVLKFNAQEQLEVIHKINTSYASHVEIWEQEGSIYMVLAQFMKEGRPGPSFEVDTPIYKWNGRYFDVIQFVRTYGALKISHFSISGIHYLAIANLKSDDDFEVTYSEVLKYDIDTERYQQFRKIRTHGCMDIKIFTMLVEEQEEHFLIVANSYDRGKGGINLNIPSMMYKFVDDYFIPFQTLQVYDVAEWHPVKTNNQQQSIIFLSGQQSKYFAAWKAKPLVYIEIKYITCQTFIITVENGQVVLFAATTFDGIKCFHYNGWRFVESQIKSGIGVMPAGVKAMHFYRYQNKTVAVITSEEANKDAPNVFEIRFTSRNEFKSLYKEMYMWCLDKKKSIESIKDVEVLGDSSRSDVPVDPTGDEDKEAELKNILQSYMEKLEEIEANLNRTLLLEEKIIEGNIKATHLILNGQAIINSIEADLVNDFSMASVLENVIKVSEGFEIDTIDFNILNLKEKVLPETVNNFPLETLVHRQDDINIENLNVNSEMEFLSELNVAGNINGIVMNKDNVLLKTGDQTFGNFNVKNVAIDDLEVNMEMQGVEKAKIKKLKELKANKIVLRGFINDIDLATIDKYALKVNGSQTITKNYYFENIDANNLETSVLSEKQVLEDFIVTTVGSYEVNMEVEFIENVVAHKLEAEMNLNGIPVTNGKLDILQKDSSERQYISGIKSFENLELLNPIQLRGKIRSKVLDSMNPGVTIGTDLDLSGDIRITGDVTAEEIVKSNDVVAGDGARALLRVRQQGLKLTDTEMPVHLNFVQHINVDGVFVERINNIDPDTWVVNGATLAQIIRGSKQFGGDLEITGDTAVFRMNDIDIGEWDENVLRQNGDQVVSGKHYVQRIVAENGIKSNGTKFGLHKLTDIVTIGDQAIDERVIFNNLACNTITTPNLIVDGFANEINITFTLNDVATTDTTFKIFSHKTLDSITIENLKLKNKNVINQMKPLETYDVKLMGNMNATNEITVNNIHFNGSCNGVGKSNFTVNKGKANESRVISGNQEFDTVIVYGKVYIGDNTINGVNLTNVENNTVKVDEAFEFETVTFNEIIVNNSMLKLNGHIEHLDIDNIFQNTEDLQTIVDEKIFEDGVIVQGNCTFEGLLNGLNISDICEFTANNTDSPKSLIIGGNAYFAKGPNVLQFNELDVDTLEDIIWFTDKPSVINGYIKFNNRVTFKNNITVLEQVNDFNLKLIEKNYLSKSKNQTVSAHMQFLKGALFISNISAPQFKEVNEINGINIERFIKTVLLNTDQTFDENPYFEMCRVTNLSGNYYVNGLDFQNEIMRYDQQNLVTGHKKFINLDIANLAINNNIKIQGVDVAEWIKIGVLNHGSFQIVGTKELHNISLSKGISVKGLLNDRKFNEETVMLKNTPQNVTGKKTFIGDTQDGVTFKALKVMDSVNDVDVAELAHNQALRTGDNIFKSEIHFYGNISTKNLIIKGLYQGVNVTDLLKNISMLNALNNFEEKYRSLQQMSSEVQQSLVGQAYFLDYYKSVGYIPHAIKVFGKITGEGNLQIMVVNYEYTSTVLQFFDWNEQFSVFENKAGYSVSIPSIPSYIEQINLGETDYIYIENKVEPADNSGYPFLGRLIHFRALVNTTQFENYRIRSNGAIFARSFKLEVFNQYCLIFIDYEEDMHIMCINGDGNFYLLQVFTEKSQQASVLNMGGVSYLVSIKSATREEEPRTSIWKFNNETSRFELYQTIYEGDPISLTTVAYNCGYYVAVAYRHLQNTMGLGRVVIRRFENDTREFNVWQSIPLGTPRHIEFSILPSEEVVLYILTENPTEPLIVYVYEGISGFNRKIVGSAIPYVISMNRFSINDKHFVVTQHLDYVNIIQAIFKGEKLY